MDEIVGYKKIDLNSWNRKKQFEFYKDFSEPFFGVTVDVDVTNLYQQAKLLGESVFISYLYGIAKAINDIEQFRYRIKEDAVVLYEKVGVSATIARDDETFGFSYIEYAEDWNTFSELAKKEIARVKTSRDFSPGENVFDTIHFTSLPWLKFTSISHARHFEFADSIPKMACGKIYEKDGSFFMPVSVHVHHALLDGFHVSLFYSKLEDFFKTHKLNKTI